MGHDVDGVVLVFALFFQFLLCQVPCFLDGFDRNLASAADVVEVTRQCDQDDRVLMSQAEEVKATKKGMVKCARRAFSMSSIVSYLKLSM